MKRFVGLKKWSFMFAAVLLLTGCVILGDKVDQFRWHFTTVPFFVFDNAPKYKQPPQPRVMHKPVNVTLALSGGGSRAAVFAAGVMEQLAYLPRPESRSILEQTQVISGVSAGSLAATYYALYKPERFRTVEEKQAFFQQFKSHMATDFFMRSWFHYLSHPWEAVLKHYTRYRFSQTLANTFDQLIFLGATFGDLSKREASGAAPLTIVNAVDLDTGCRFLMTNLNVSKSLKVNPSAFQGDPLLSSLAKAAASPAYCATGFDAIDSDILSFRLASAVAASSAFPVLPGPLAIRNYATGGYVHLADGGIVDNTGVDSIIQLYLSQTRGDTSRRLVVISLDAALPVAPIHDKDPNGFVSGMKYGEHAFATAAAKGQTLASILYNQADSIRIIRLSLWESPRTQKLDKTTNYYISESDWLTVLCAAQEVVQAHREEILQAVYGR